MSRNFRSGYPVGRQTNDPYADSWWGTARDTYNAVSQAIKEGKKIAEGATAAAALIGRNFDVPQIGG